MRLVVSGLASLLPLAVWIADWQIGGLHIADCILRIVVADCRLADWQIAD